ncbi:hypothetical protein BJ165DRAFT_1444946 [Panaeolus papilionaceus]|nr:hypothetical protein BJ165DRAFT_1444946 [Panaeolus papilionaceus]
MSIVELEEVSISSSSIHGRATQPTPYVYDPSTDSSRPPSRRTNSEVHEKNTPSVNRNRPAWLGDQKWKCGEPYEVPFPSENDGDSWETIYNTVREHDDIMCDAWIDEVQNILIFAGLFSAVVTAFVVESQQLLEEDPAITTALLLSQIASQLAGNSSQQDTLQTTLEPFDDESLAQAFRVNSLLFVSLVLSLATALFGIMVLQWIRAFRKRESLSYKQLLCLRQSRYQSLVKWKIPEIVTMLPVLLQVSLVIFFAGLIDFLNLTYPNIATVVGVFIGLTLLFVVVTTILPTFCLFSTPTEGIPDVLCAYQSPQSWMFVKLAHIVINVIFRRMPLKIMKYDYLYLSCTDWTQLVSCRSFDLWLPSALSWTIRTFKNSIEPFGAVYQSFQSLDPNEEWKVIDQLAQDTYLQSWPPLQVTPTKMSNTIKDKPGFMRDLFSCQVLNLTDSSVYSQIAAHHLEAYLRCMAELTSDPTLIPYRSLLASNPPALYEDQRHISDGDKLKVQKQHVWYLYCNEIERSITSGSILSGHEISWIHFWEILNTEYEDLSVVTVDAAFMLLGRWFYTMDTTTHGKAMVECLSGLLLYHDRWKFGRMRMTDNPLFISLLDYLTTERKFAKVLQDTALTLGGTGNVARKIWKSLVEEYDLDEKYLTLFGSS